MLAIIENYIAIRIDKINREALNFQNTGIRAMIEPDMEFIDEFYIGVGNGWDTIYDEGENQEKTFEAAFGTT
mgnify:CR=1 FL=1